MYRVLVIVVVGCAATPPPVGHPSATLPHDEQRWVVGEPDTAGVSWSCSRFTDECDDAVTVVPMCLGVQCDVEIVGRDGFTPGASTRGLTFAFIPREPGTMTKILYVRDRSGVVERREVGRDEVIARPDASLSCTIHDPGSGADLPCPPRMSSSSDVFVAATTAPDVELALDSGAIDIALTCNRDDSERVRCHGRLRPGHHEIAARLGSAKLATIALDVD